MATRELALVTGASGGLGFEFARLLAGDGYDLAIVARSGDKLQAVAGELSRRFGVNVQTIVQDLGVPDAAEAVFAQVPRCDILINNAGFASNGRFDELPEARIREELLLDVVTLTELTRKYVPGMRERKSGRILNVASTAAFLPGPFMAVYYAAKAYVLSFSEAIAEELAGSGVTATCLCPGATATGFQDRAAVHDKLLLKLPTAKAPDVARAGYYGMLRGKRVVIPGLTNNIVAISPKITPRRLLLWMSRKAVE
jgi:short-subunit dehydrogenase